MAVVDAQRVNRYLSEPFWTQSQWDEAETLCVEKEDELAGMLVTPITPIAFEETVAVLDSGLVATTYPVVTVTSFLGEPVDDTHPLPSGWVLINNRVRATPGTTIVPLSFAALAPLFGVVPRIQGSGEVTIGYQAGWGPVPALVNGIVRKVAAIMKNRHDDTLMTDDAGSATGKQTPTVVEEWTDKELARFGIYRNPRGMAWR